MDHDHDHTATDQPAAHTSSPALQDKLTRIPDLATILTSPTAQTLGGAALLSALAIITPDRAIIIHGG